MLTIRAIRHGLHCGWILLGIICHILRLIGREQGCDGSHRGKHHVCDQHLLDALEQPSYAFSSTTRAIAIRYVDVDALSDECLIGLGFFHIHVFLVVHAEIYL